MKKAMTAAAVMVLAASGAWADGTRSGKPRARSENPSGPRCGRPSQEQRTPARDRQAQNPGPSTSVGEPPCGESARTAPEETSPAAPERRDTGEEATRHSLGAGTSVSRKGLTSQQRGEMHRSTRKAIGDALKGSGMLKKQ